MTPEPKIKLFNSAHYRNRINDIFFLFCLSSSFSFMVMLNIHTWFIKLFVFDSQTSLAFFYMMQPNNVTWECQIWLFKKGLTRSILLLMLKLFDWFFFLRICWMFLLWGFGVTGWMRWWVEYGFGTNKAVNLMVLGSFKCRLILTSNFWDFWSCMALENLEFRQTSLVKYLV